jgi:hypothetical protein
MMRLKMTPSSCTRVKAGNQPDLFGGEARKRMAAGGGDKKSGVENLPPPLEDGKARDKAGARVGVGGRTVDDVGSYFR